MISIYYKFHEFFGIIDLRTAGQSTSVISEQKRIMIAEIDLSRALADSDEDVSKVSGEKGVIKNIKNRIY